MRKKPNLYQRKEASEMITLYFIKNALVDAIKFSV